VQEDEVRGPWLRRRGVAGDDREDAGQSDAHESSGPHGAPAATS